MHVRETRRQHHSPSSNSALASLSPLTTLYSWFLPGTSLFPRPATSMSNLLCVDTCGNRQMEDKPCKSHTANRLLVLLSPHWYRMRCDIRESTPNTVCFWMKGCCKAEEREKTKRTIIILPVLYRGWVDHHLLLQAIHFTGVRRKTMVDLWVKTNWNRKVRKGTILYQLRTRPRRERKKRKHGIKRSIAYGHLRSSNCVSFRVMSARNRDRREQVKLRTGMEYNVRGLGVFLKEYVPIFRHQSFLVTPSP